MVFTACRKHGDNEDLKDKNDPVSDYMSTKKGSWWLYASADGTVLKRRATGRDSMKMDLVFNYYESTDTNSGHVTPEYFGKNGDKYIMLIDIDGSETNYMPAVIQKDNAKVGDTWDNTGTIKYGALGKIDLLTQGEVMSVNGTMTINGHIYTHVTEIDNKLKAKPAANPAYIKCGTAKMWFSKGVGVIKSEFNINIMGIIKKEYKDSIVDYYIEP